MKKEVGISDDDDCKQKNLFDSLGLSKASFDRDGFKFQSRKGNFIATNRTFKSLEELEACLVTPINREFGEEMIMVIQKGESLVINCKAKHCTFRATYSCVEAFDGSLRDIKLNNKGKQSAHHSIEAHTSHDLSKFTLVEPVKRYVR